MILAKKLKLCLLGIVLLAACKSADCGCPMAKKETTQEIQTELKITKTFHKVIVTD